MALIEQVASYIENVPKIWREDFCLLIEGETPSSEFLEFFDTNNACQEIAEQIMRATDYDFALQLARAVVVES